MNELTVRFADRRFRRNATVEAVGVDGASSVVTFPRFTAYRVAVGVRGYFRTHATGGVGIGLRSAIYLDDIGAASYELVTDTDVFHHSIIQVGQGGDCGSIVARIIVACTRNPIQPQVEATEFLGWCVSEESERAHVPAFSSSSTACCDTYVKSPERGAGSRAEGVGVIEGLVYSPHPKGLFKDCGAATALTCAAIQCR